MNRQLARITFDFDAASSLVARGMAPTLSHARRSPSTNPGPRPAARLPERTFVYDGSIVTDKPSRVPGYRRAMCTKGKDVVTVRQHRSSRRG